MTRHALLALVCACSAGSDAAPKPDDAGADHDTPKDAGAPETPDGLANCGGTPSFRYTLKALELQNDGTASLLAGATVSFDICPGVTARTDGSGLTSIDVHRGVPFVARVTAPGDMPVLFGESLVGVTDPLTELKTEALVPVLPAPPAIPAYSFTEPLLVVDILANGSCGPGNVVLAVVGHPEAKMHCMLPNWPADPTDSIVCGASLGPIVFFSGITGATSVQLTTSGCKATVAGPPLAQTGNFPLENSVLTVANVSLP